MNKLKLISLIRDVRLGYCWDTNQNPRGCPLLRSCCSAKCYAATLLIRVCFMLSPCCIIILSHKIWGVQKGYENLRLVTSHQSPGTWISELRLVCDSQRETARAPFPSLKWSIITHYSLRDCHKRMINGRSVHRCFITLTKSACQICIAYSTSL